MTAALGIPPSRMVYVPTGFVFMLYKEGVGVGREVVHRHLYPGLSRGAGSVVVCLGTRKFGTQT